MNTKKLLLSSLLAAAGLLLGISLFARRRGKPAPVKLLPEENPYNAIDAYVEEQMQRLHIPGASLAIVEADRVVHTQGFGKARPGGETPTSQTPFFIGSITKSFTALAIMQLVEAGKVELDTPVQHYLPWFRVADPAASAQMTVRHLLNQTSGLSTFTSQLVLAYPDDSPGATERMVRDMSTLKLNYPVGEKCQYCNLNYNILGLIVETASGESYTSYIQTHIFDPLEMHHSYTSKATAQPAGLAVGHRHWFSLPFLAPNMPHPRGGLPAGLLISCAEDMAHYLIAHLNDGRYRNVQILSEAGIDETHRGAAVIAEWQGSIIRYGMGWFETDIGSTKVCSHGGNLPDFSAYMSLVPGQKKGLIVIFNADPYGLPFVTDEIGTGMTALLAGQESPPIKLDFIQWIMRLLPLIPVLQVAGVLVTLHKMNRWEKNPARLPTAGRMWRQHILPPLIPNLSLTALLVYLRSSGLIRYLHLYNPDLAWTIRISGGFAAIWACLCTGLMLKQEFIHQKHGELEDNKGSK